MKNYSKIISLFLCITLSANTAFGISLQNNLAQYHKYDNPPKNTTIKSTCLVGLFDYYFMKNNQKNFQAFPLENLPRDIQNSISSYLPFEIELINRLNKPQKTKSSEGVITLKGNNLKIEIIPEKERIRFTKFDKSSCWNNLDKITNFHYDTISHAESFQEVSPNFKKLILVDPELQKDNLVSIINLDKNYKFIDDFYDKEFQYLIVNLNTNKKINVVAINDEGNAIAYSDSEGIYYDGFSKPLICLKTLNYGLDPIRLEFNKKETMLGIKYRNGKTEILPIPGKKIPQKTLQQYFYENIIKKTLKHYASETKTSLDELD